MEYLIHPSLHPLLGGVLSFTYLPKSFSLDTSDKITFQIIEVILISDETRFSVTVSNYLRTMYHSNCCIEQPFFPFPSYFPFINWISRSFELFELWIFCCFPSWVPSLFDSFLNFFGTFLNAVNAGYREYA